MGIELSLLADVVWRGQQVAGPRVRALLALLAMDLRGGVGVARLVDGVWGEALPENPGKALQVVVSRARSQVGSDVIASTSNGYRLALSAEQVDAAALEMRAAAAERHARAADHRAALDQAEAGLALWDGQVDELADEGDPLSVLRFARLPAYRTLVRVRATTLARLGRYSEAVGPLAEVAGEAPRDEEVLAELIRAEADTVGPAAALVRYDAYRRMLRDELGADPGDALKAVHRQLLRANEPVVRHGIRHDPNPLLGRAEDIATVSALLRTSRVVSIVGPGGLGKTRLAHAVGLAAEQRSVHLIELAGVLDPGAVAAEVAGALGAGDLNPAGTHTAATGLVAGIARKLGAGPALLILDNCEQVLAGAAELVSALVSLTGELRVLVTSRAPLGVSSEAVHWLPALPTETTVELFTQRARAVRADVELPAVDVAALCAELDGLPLAVELAAARVRVMSVAEMSQRLGDRFALLRSGSRDAPQRHRTLRAVVEWSWNLLDEAGRATMRMLSVFPGGCTAEAGSRVLGADVDDTLDSLTYLVDQSLLQSIETDSGMRFRMLETVRDFAAVERREAGEDERSLDEFLSWACDFAVAQNRHAFTDIATAGIVRAEQDNLVYALRCGLDRADGPTVAATWAALGSWWFVGAHYARITESARECAHVLSHFRPEPALVEVTRTAATVIALSGVTQGGFERRSVLVLRRLPAAEPDTPVRAMAAMFLAAPELLGQGSAALDRLCASEKPLLAGIAHLLTSVRAEQLGDRDTALTATERMLAAVRHAPGDWLRYQAHCRIARLALLSERSEQAQREFERALALIEHAGPRPDRADFLVGSAMAALQLGDVDAAQQWLAQVPDRADPFAHPYALVAHAEIRLARGEVEGGLWRWREIATLLSSTENPFYRPDPRNVQVWAMEAHAAAVLAHAGHDRVELVADLVEDLAEQVNSLLEQPAAQPAGYLAELTACGAGLLALAIVDLRRGRTTAGARLVALAQRFDPPHQIHPTMSGQRSREDAENADGVAYVEARSTYATLDVPDLRSAALQALRDRLTTGLAVQ
ncbi:ATP-binding protein [Nocardia sp. CA-107356]|uniref:ATP-binding protein n=1 Tax=Nocardia sp. CA-107356 TaxID=3239972 RepID=UPI003D8B90E1